MFDEVCFEKPALDYPLGKTLLSRYPDLPWTPIESHNNIPDFRKRENRDFPGLKRKLIIGVRKTHKYVENQKISDYLVPYTSSGCTAMCLYCYLVCNYNKCAYLRLFVNREQMMKKLIKTSLASPGKHTFEIGSNSDLVLENTITDNLPWTIDTFCKEAPGKLTFPTKFGMVQPLLPLDHQGKVMIRMSVNPREVIRRIELGTSPLEERVKALNALCEADYPVGILLAPVVLLPNWQKAYAELLEELADTLSEKVKKMASFEVIFMTYSFVHRAINTEAFPGAPSLYQPEMMTGRGRGKYWYREPLRVEGEAFLRSEIEKTLPGMPILYVV